jgi:hypothetical protein
VEGPPGHERRGHLRADGARELRDSKLQPRRAPGRCGAAQLGDVAVGGGPGGEWSKK